VIERHAAHERGMVHMAKNTGKNSDILGEDGFKDVSPTLMRFLKEGDELVGALTALDTVTVNSKACHRAWIDTADKGRMVMLMTAQLEPIFANLHADGSVVVKVVYMGEIKIEGGRKVKEFKVFTKLVGKSS